jgi:hypothetical protein
MKLIVEEYTPIKKTKSVEMLGNKEDLLIKILSGTEGFNSLLIPADRNMTRVFQVKRGLEAYIQKFYRRKNAKRT